MGLLPFIAEDLGASIPSLGHAISLYALGVVVGAPAGHHPDHPDGAQAAPGPRDPHPPCRLDARGALCSHAAHLAGRTFSTLAVLLPETAYPEPLLTAGARTTRWVDLIR